MTGKRIMVADGNEVAATVAYPFTEVATIYPITPSSPMAEHTDEWSAQGRLNMFGQPVTLVEMQSEAGAIGAVHGACETGALGVSFTSSQGLMLMIPVLHRIAGCRLPAVLHVASRTVGTHAMSIFGDHSDVMSCRNTGFAQLCSGSVQEIADLAAVAHLAAIESRIPFMHFFDGFRTSHEIDKVEVLPEEVLTGLIDQDALARFREGALNPEHPTLRNTVQNPDVFFQIREANNGFYEALPDTVERYLAQINSLTGRDYHLFNYYGSPNAQRVIVAMGSVAGAVRETVAQMNAAGENVGFLQVHLYRPFSKCHLLDALPASVRSIAVLDRVKEMGSAGEPLYLDVCAAFVNRPDAPHIIGGRYGLSSKDTDPAQIKAVFDNLAVEHPIESFTVGIEDDVTHRSLLVDSAFAIEDPATIACKFWGLGSDGTVGANKNSIKIIGEETDRFAQGYFEFDTKKAFGVTRSHLRFGTHPIYSSYLVHEADFIACHNQSFLQRYDMLNELKQGGTFLLNCEWPAEQVAAHLPAAVKRRLAQQNAAFYVIDADRIAHDIGLGNRPNIVLQAAFFSLANVLPLEEAVGYMKDAVEKTYARKGRRVVDMNLAAVDAGLSAAVRVEVPSTWKSTEAPTADTTTADSAADAADSAADTTTADSAADTADDTADDTAAVSLRAESAAMPAFVRDVVMPSEQLRGDDLPVSAFVGHEDGTMPLGNTRFAKRGFATSVPQWDPDACTQCNKCSLVCPHAVIRPYLLDAAEQAAAPAGFAAVPAKGKAGKAGYAFSIQVSALDCTGCGCCEAVCPAAGQALQMQPAPEAPDTAAWDFGLTISEKPDAFKAGTVKGSQFKQPLLEFSGACAGCGETPYAKLLTQLYGDRIYWANATGCSQAWAAAGLSIPYAENKAGKGVAWSNSLFENNAEFSLGMFLSVRQQRAWVRDRAQRLQEIASDKALCEALSLWLDCFDDLEKSHPASDALVASLKAADLAGEADGLRRAILSHADQLGKKTIWMFGGDGWAYDIGFGGLDHVIAQNDDVNVFIIDTEVYSNTGGQSSKGTPLGAVSKFQYAGKKTPKKDLGRLLMSYGNCYVASVAMGADASQLVRAIEEAQAFPGPAVIIAYTPCIVHGIKRGIANVQEEMACAVKAGYWTLYRFDPRQDHPFKLDSPEPTLDYEEFLRGEVRYSSLDLTFPDNAKQLFAEAADEARQRYEFYRDLAER